MGPHMVFKWNAISIRTFCGEMALIFMRFNYANQSINQWTPQGANQEREVSLSNILHHDKTSI